MKSKLKRFFLYTVCTHTQTNTYTHTPTDMGVSSWWDGLSIQLQNHSKWVQTPFVLLHSLSDKYLLERHEPPYLLSYRLNTNTTVLLEGWIWYKITQEGWYAIKQQTNPRHTHMYILLWRQFILPFFSHKQELLCLRKRVGILVTFWKMDYSLGNMGKKRIHFRYHSKEWVIKIRPKRDSFRKSCLWSKQVFWFDHLLLNFVGVYLAFFFVACFLWNALPVHPCCSCVHLFSNSYCQQPLECQTKVIYLLNKDREV